MPLYENGPVRICYEEFGSGFPLLLISGGGLDGCIKKLTNDMPFNPVEEFKNDYRCIAFDQRHANDGQSFGPLEIDRPWEAHIDDCLGLMDHLGIDRFMTLSFCFGGPVTWNLLRRAPDRVVASVIVQPSGFRPEAPDFFYDGNMQNWGPRLYERRPDVTMEMIDAFLTTMYRKNADFVFSVTRDDVRNCQAPVLILPDDITAHPYDVAMETAMLAPNAQVSLYPWKDIPERIPLALRHIRMFLNTHRPE
ncbi:MAG: alpha/beta hydrolase [Rhodospirillaceae bacterium]|jgi:pimeloyl-ACP methyl ester carboxylesterase